MATPPKFFDSSGNNNEGNFSSNITIYSLETDPQTNFYYKNIVSGAVIDDNGTFNNDQSFSNISLPTYISQELITTDNFILRMIPNEQALYYLIDVASDNTFTTYLDGYHDYPTSSTSLLISGTQIASATNVFVRVRVVTSYGNSAYSNIMEVIFP